MINSTSHFHGSDLETIEQVYNIQKDDIVSFADNVNPLGISPKLRETLSDRIDSIMTYPDREYTSLRNKIASYVKAQVQDIIVGNGATELISLFIQIIKPKKAMIVGPTYSEYEREVSLGGGCTLYYRLEEKNDFKIDIDALDKELNSDIDLLVICNPNNPTSTAISRPDMRRILDICKKKGIFVMVDETYVEFTEDIHNISSIPLTKHYNNIVILRGISKFFAAPGLRLGYAVCGNTDLIKEMNQRKNPWTINSLAAIAGEIMFTDEEYIAKTRHLISTERDRVYRLLMDCPDIKVYKPTANFVLVQILKDDINSMDIFEASVKKGYLIRDCSTFPFLSDRFFRFCFMTAKQNDSLLSILFESLSK